MKTNSKFESLWSHVTGVCSNKPSPVSLAIYEAMSIEIANEFSNPRGLYPLKKRIANQDGFDYEGRCMVAKVSGEWHITNSDLKLWADMSLFGSRDYFPEDWGFFSAGIISALHKKRRYQALLRFRENGRLNDDHRKLLGALRWDVDFGRGDWVSLYVDGKRPMGDSSRVMRMCEVMGWPMPWLDDEADEPEEIKERCWELFDELPFAIQDVIAN